MRSPMLALILFSVTLSGLAQVSFKIGMSSEAVRGAISQQVLSKTLLAVALSPGVIVGLVLYGVGTLAWLSVLSRTQLSLAYPFVGFSFIITAALGFLLFHEALGPSRLVGTALVIAGVVLVGRG
jgi:multidrug transporter EmrE-like cation transporter